MTNFIGRNLRTASRVLSVFVAIVVAAMAISSASAEEWPTRPVKIVVPFGAGGITDSLVRLLADRLSKSLHQPFVIENRAGAGGAIGTEYAAHSVPDGYTLYFGSAAQHYALPLMQALKYDPQRDFVPVSILNFNPMMLVSLSSFPPKTLDEFIAYAKARPGQLSYSTGGFGTATHLVPALLAVRAGIDAVAIPSGSGPGAMNDLMSGATQFYVGQPSDVLSGVAGGAIRLIATTGDARVPRFPDVPTLSERYPDLVVLLWNACFVPPERRKPSSTSCRRLSLRPCMIPK